MSDQNNDPRDPFKQRRQSTGVHHMRAEGQDMPLVLRLGDVRRTANDWKTFSNDDPLMIVPHSEADVRSVRQVPIETDPPVHTAYRAIVEPLFNRPNDPMYQASMQTMVSGLVADAIKRGTIEVVRELAIPIQSRGLAKLLNVDDSQAEIWIGWGTHIFKDGDGKSKGAVVENYARSQFEAKANSTGANSTGDDFFSVLNRASYQGRALTMEEKLGYAILAFAGGRDTVIHTVTSIIAYFAHNPKGLDFLRADAFRITTATEEFVRYVSPLTAIARKCPHGGKVANEQVGPGQRIGLCWPSANRDETVFEKADEVVLDRSPNPHVGFGFGVHRCLGAPQARLIIRSLLQALCEQVGTLATTQARPQMETESSFTRQVGYELLEVAFAKR
jgi:cytochrome P450